MNTLPPGTVKPTAACSLLLADDSTAYRMALSSALMRDHSITILGEVEDGQAAVTMVASCRPDIALLDVMMPRLDGIEAARRITSRYGIPVLLMSALARYPEQRPDLSGLPSGLVELIDKPVLVGPAAAASIAALIAHIKALAKAQFPAQAAKGTAVRPTQAALVVLAASTGGLEALRSVLGRLPNPFPPMVIAQHIDASLGKQLAALLQDALGRQVVTVEQSAKLLPNRLYVAGPALHLLIRQGEVVARPADRGEIAPSADRLFASAATAYGPQAVGVVLTGMGHDGALGLGQLRDAGGWTIAQDQASSMVDGMPRAARDKGVCCEVLSLTQIGERLSRLTMSIQRPR